MTTEQQEQEPQQYQWPDEAYAQLSVPDVPYSAIRVPLGYDYAAVMQEAQALREAYLAAFGAPPAPEPPQQRQQPQRPAQRPQGRPQPQRQQPPQANGGQPGGAEFGVRVTCPQDGADCRPSIKNKQIEYDDQTGLNLPASWFHSDGNGGTHTVWRSQAVIEELG